MTSMSTTPEHVPRYEASSSLPCQQPDTKPEISNFKKGVPTSQDEHKLSSPVASDASSSAAVTSSGNDLVASTLATQPTFWIYRWGNRYPDAGHEPESAKPVSAADVRYYHKIAGSGKLPDVEKSRDTHPQDYYMDGETTDDDVPWKPRPEPVEHYHDW